MRVRHTTNGLTVNAIAGTHVVFFGLDLSAQRRKGCLGFAVQRVDKTEDETYWMRGTKTFAATAPAPPAGVDFSSREQPFQTFQWADYTAKPGHEYTYRTVPLYGTPENPTEGAAVSVDVKTEPLHDGKYAVFFNRGAIASQEYAKRFQNRAPDEVGKTAYEWLSRGLLEAMLEFIGRAKGKGWGLRGAVYEFQWPEVLDAIRAAATSGADVKIIIDAIEGKSGPRKKNLAAIAAEKVTSRCVQKTKGKLMHNKFFVLTRKGEAVAVWTGSTNVTENGIFGHLNCGHIVEDAAVAAEYLEYWSELRGNPDTAGAKSWIDANNVRPPSPWKGNSSTVFSPHKGEAVLQWYADLAATAKGALFMTFAFGMSEQFKKIYEQDDGILRFALMEKEGNGSGLAQGKIDIRRIRKLPNVLVAVANNLELNAFDRWLAERRALSSEVNVRWIHTKFMLVDPLGKHPVVITGSANFSKASTDTNDENMLVIRNDTRIADIYFTEFMRLYSHYAFREAVAIANKSKSKTQVPAWNPKFLIPDASWQDDYYKAGNDRMLRRVYFSGN